MKKFDTIDIILIVVISIYLVTLLMFLFTLVDTEVSKRKKEREKEIHNKKVIKEHPNNLIKNKHYKHNISYPN